MIGNMKGQSTLLATILALAAAPAYADLSVSFWAASPNATTASFTVSGTYLATANQTWPSFSRNVWGGGDFVSSSIGSNPDYDFPIAGSLTITNLSNSSSAPMSHIFLRHVGNPLAQDQIAFKFGDSFTWETGDVLNLVGSGTIDLSFHNDSYADLFPGTYNPVESDSRYSGGLTLEIAAVPEPGTLSFAVGALLWPLVTRAKRKRGHRTA